MRINAETVDRLTISLELNGAKACNISGARLFARRLATALGLDAPLGWLNHGKRTGPEDFWRNNNGKKTSLSITGPLVHDLRKRRCHGRRHMPYNSSRTVTYARMFPMSLRYTPSSSWSSHRHPILELIWLLQSIKDLLDERTPCQYVSKTATASLPAHAWCIPQRNLCTQVGVMKCSIILVMSSVAMSCPSAQLT
ncbi:hypothetical protein P153DRAFT_146045 [Dothidotthia symphoricarpi CBS 119687]|uniref:Uncharacterized protein n=1 Tax=Dothidotthia symphoricarpi CBS 119687 TaxID=1392245 RepID=A0A6A5ZXN7_9PLEO|nr:uncharacterized protein P153DRAFT_146045 [Dothidotthia symphoricarpi CBS 119687]KAF2123785.1 hypothetical protein P153DRAFT_146045 [Dothidotthia symphoricarpi CBS 119687]